ncbi:hypothetical protein [Arthrospira platensis]|uniref:hypothetical protein n=1 Tax=Limnospira TaxID=2596745 RepID=UPI0001D0EF95|nr:hypothetical protein [Arthrospira platensis]MBD2671793.1 hypothetical protein [Arthrospira platensis FACHB-439]MBD2712713.1 hypothetical protein [Arthrospira platensis FACHB-835]MDF2210165.1 hypothetical protein [Arthrospira platensis NCB002]MDT9185392.1 hypothetical protein [Limnospira sp. PMC 289.06]MDT9297618.1 hypothetical protein [Arthrospira platensis PCC 7345]MDT9313049.1 hypothetical protein [Limnospira sp. Paracas R14]QQW30798.1 hypothetical protein AP9108_09225 [Arthrospira sp. 
MKGSGCYNFGHGAIAFYHSNLTKNVSLPERTSNQASNWVGYPVKAMAGDRI